MLSLQGPQAKGLHHLLDALHTNLPLLVVSDNCQMSVQNLQTLASASNTKMVRILLNSRSDTTQLLGCFEQTASDIESLAEELLGCIFIEQDKLLDVQCRLRRSSDKESLLKEFAQQLEPAEADALLRRLSTFATQRTRFQWIDSTLISAIERGHWAVFESANMCPPSILDRLNSLLEEGNHRMTLNEQGLADDNQLREVTCHPNFRAIFLVDRKSLVDGGRDVSRALRNRCMEIRLEYDEKEAEAPGTGEQVVANQARRLATGQNEKIFDAYYS